MNFPSAYAFYSSKQTANSINIRQGAQCEAFVERPFCILHSAFCILNS